MDIESVYTQYFKDVFLYVRSLSADAGTAEEIAQGTGVYALLVLPESVIPYEESGVSVSSVSLGDLGGKYLYCSIGTSEAAGSVCHDPVTVQTEEGEKTVVILYAYSTPWSKYVETNLENGREDSVILEPLGSADEIDEVYYGEFEPVSEFYEGLCAADEKKVDIPSSPW